MDESIIFSILLFAIGLFSVIISIANWDYFLKPKKGTTVIKLFGRSGTRIEYMLFGLLIMSAGVVSMSIESL